MKAKHSTARVRRRDFAAADAGHELARRPATLTPLDGLKTRLQCDRHRFRYLARAGAKGLSRCPLCVGEEEVRSRAAKRRLVRPNKADAKTPGRGRALARGERT